jgi:hypothetical protein
MPALDPTQVRIAGTGSIWKAPVGTPIPTDSASAWNAAFINLGYAKDGFSLTQDYKTADITTWQSLEVVRSISTALIRKFQFELQQTNKTNLALALGGAAISIAGTSIGTVVVAITSGVLTTSVAHNLQVGNPVQLQGVTGGAPFVSGVTYYVQSIPTGTTLTLALTAGGASIATTTAGTATGIILVTGAYSLAIPNAAAIADFMLGIDWSDGATSMRFIIQRAHYLTLPVVKYSRVAEASYIIDVQALAPNDGTASVLVFGVDAAVGV